MSFLSCDMLGPSQSPVQRRDHLSPHMLHVLLGLLEDGTSSLKDSHQPISQLKKGQESWLLTSQMQNEFQSLFFFLFYFLIFSFVLDSPSIWAGLELVLNCHIQTIYLLVSDQQLLLRKGGARHRACQEQRQMR